MAQITVVQSRLENIKDIVSGLKASRRLKTSSGKYWEKQLEVHQKLIHEFNDQINDPAKIYENNIMRAERRSGSKFTTDVTRIYRQLGDEVKVVGTFDKGVKIYWNKGDVLVENPKTLVAGNDVISRSRRAMHDAFARKDANISDNQMQIIEYHYGEFFEKLRNTRENFIDPDAPKTAMRLGLRSEAELKVLADALVEVGNISPDNASNLQKQFLYRLLTPSAPENVFDIVGWNPNTKKKKLFPHFRSNKSTEQLVFKFLQRAMSKNAEMIVGSETATEWYKTINDRFKVAFLKQYSPTIEQNIFNFEKTSRLASDFGLLPKADQLPKFVTEINLNEQAKDVLQSYLNGTYFLDSIETYRLTIDMMKKSLEELPNLKGIGDQIEFLWKGTKGIQLGNGAWYKPSHTFRKETYHNPEKGTKENATDFLKKQFKECF
jgi:hypothetical protein